ncbi:ATP-binding protein [Bradyrhizobium brasilense]|uniref:ATP-binding protein n=1 Tax=Bradyrhizobium brasilense TaxID=1419277 RepID=UPI0024C0C5D1|nr:ATP-binding protein [Bradyrhizobium brasilense]
MACALGHKACRDNRSVLYHRVPRLFEALVLARGDGRYARLLKTQWHAQLLIWDDWGLSVLTVAARRESTGNPRGSPWPRLHPRCQPTPRGHMARSYRRSPTRGRHHP